MTAVDGNCKSCKAVKETKFEDIMPHKPGKWFVQDLKYAGTHAFVKHGESSNGAKAVYLLDVVRNSVV